MDVDDVTFCAPKDADGRGGADTVCEGLLTAATWLDEDGFEFTPTVAGTEGDGVAFGVTNDVEGNGGGATDDDGLLTGAAVDGC